MIDSEYAAILRNSLWKLRALIQQREETELEISKIRQFMRATLNMLPDNERQKLEWALNMIDTKDVMVRAGLANAIRDVLGQFPKKWFTAAQVRDALQRSGFNFGGYTSNPLSSVSTTLRRFKSPDIEKTEIDGVAAYRRKDMKGARKRKLEQSQMDSILEALDVFSLRDAEAKAHPLPDIPEETIFDAADYLSKREGKEK
jgi:hypothetical protein